MNNRVKLTAGRITDFECEADKTQQFLWDTEAPGLAVRATASGAKAYIFQSRLTDKTIRITIGDVKTWAIEAAHDKAGNLIRDGARQEARRLQALIDQKIDPRQAKAEEIAAAEARQAEQQAKEEAAENEAQRQAVLVGDAWATYLAHQKDKMTRPHIERGKKWGARHLLDHEHLAQAGGEPKKRGGGMTTAGPLYPLLTMRMTDISAETLKQWQRDEAATRANNARQAFEMFRAFWRWCASRDQYKAVIDADAVESKELRDEVPSRKSKRFDVLEKGQLPAWFAAVRGLSNPVISAYLQCLILTGARREEMAELRWQDVDFKWGALWLKDKVAEEGRKVPLTPYLRQLLDALPRRTMAVDGKTVSNPWVFSSPAAANGRLAEPRIPHNRALQVAGLPPLTLHGLRRTFASLAEWVEMPRGIVAQIMGHKPSATAEKHYIDRPLELLAVWHGKYEAWILEQAGIEQPSEPESRLRLIGKH